MGRKILGTEAEVVCAALHRQGQRDRHRESGWGARSRVHRLALGRNGKASRSRGAVQAADLRAGGQGVLEVYVSAATEDPDCSRPSWSWMATIDIISPSGCVKLNGLGDVEIPGSI